MNISTYMGMDITNAVGNTSDNYDEMRGRKLTPDKYSSRDSSMSSTVLSVTYSKQIEMNNDKDGNTIIDDDNLTQLSYATLKKQNNQVSKMADLKDNIMEQHILIKGSALNTPCASNPPHVDNDDNVINIQLLYDLNSPMESDLWNGSFYPISLHRFLEYLVSDSKNIKNSLNFIAKYITNKQIDPAKSNDIEDFKGMGEAI